jgi:hypothetical protein
MGRGVGQRRKARQGKVNSVTENLLELSLSIGKI